MQFETESTVVGNFALKKPCATIQAAQVSVTYNWNFPNWKTLCIAGCNSTKTKSLSLKCSTLDACIYLGAVKKCMCHSMSVNKSANICTIVNDCEIRDSSSN